MKNKFRKLYKSVRSSLTQKERTDSDSRIFTRFINSDLYRKCDTVLAYVSFGSEADTSRIIRRAIADGKTVAVPHCDGNKMNFYKMDSFDCLVSGRYGIPSVQPDDKLLINDFENCVCVVPALSFDKNGNRLGYGGGFYDRFLKDKNIFSVGICYERCMSNNLPSEEHDIRMKFILTENSFKKL